MKPLQIVTFTPNPALDLSGHVPRIQPNEKNYVNRPRMDPGGNGVNVARLIHRLGGRVLATGFLGGVTGKYFESLLIEEGVPCDFEMISESTRVNVTVSNDENSLQTRLTFPGPKVSPKAQKSYQTKILGDKKMSHFVLGGSIPGGLTAEYCLKLAKKAAAQSVGIVVDMPAPVLKVMFPRPTQGVRSSRPRSSLGQKSQSSPWALLVKPNQVELEEWAGKKVTNRNSALEQARKLTAGAALVVVSLGKEGAIFCTREASWFAESPRVKAKGSVGAGDSMVAGMVQALSDYNVRCADELSHLPEKALFRVFQQGVAAGAATAEAEGTALSSVGRIHELTLRVQVKRLGN